MAKNDFQYGGWNYYTLQCAFAEKADAIRGTNS